MTAQEIARMQGTSGLYFIGNVTARVSGRVLVVSQGGKLYALKLDQVLRPEGFAVGSYIAGHVEIDGEVATFEGVLGR